MSFPGSVEAAAPFAGAAHLSKGARHTESAGDFADLMRGAEASPQDASGSDDAGDSAAVAEPTPVVCEAASTDVKVDATVETPVAADQTTHTFHAPNLAGFFRSMRGQQETAAAQTKVPAPSVAGATAPAPDSAAADDAAVTATVIVDIAIPFRVVTPTVDVAPNAVTGGPGAVPTEDALVPAPITLAAPEAIETVPTPAAPVADMTTQVTMAPETPVMTEAFAAILGEPESAPVSAATSRIVTAAEHEIENASVRVPGEPYVLAAMSPNAQAAVAALRQVTAQPAAESAPVPASPVPVSPVTALPATPVLATDASTATPATTVTAVVTDDGSSASASASATTTAPAVAPKVAAKAYAETPSARSVDPAARLKVAAATAEATLAPAPRVDRPAMAAHVLSSVFVPHLSSSAPSMTAATVTSKEALTAAVESQMSDQIVQSLKMQFDQGGGEAKIELNPQYLGRVQVNVRVSQGTVSASVQAETPLVREWIASNRAELTHTLSQQGLKLDRLDVAETPKEEQTRDNGREQRQSQREPTRPRRDDRGQSVDTFEIQDSQEIA